MRVIPVLVDGARPLRQQQLPAELQKLARLNALELSYGRYEYDADRLVSLLQRLLAAAPGTGRQSSPAANVEAFTDPHDVPADGNALWTDAERAARSITDDYRKASALASIAGGTGSDRPGPHRPDHRRRGTRRAVHHRRLPQGQRARQHRGGTGSDRPGPHRPDHRRRGTRRAVHHRRQLEGQRARPHRGGTRSYRPGPRGTRRPVHHRPLLEGQRARPHRGGTGSYRPGPRGTHRPVHHQRRTSRPTRSPRSRRRWHATDPDRAEHTARLHRRRVL